MLYTVVRRSRFDPYQSITVVQDKCGELGISGWPQLNVYKDGQFVDTFRKGRQLDLLKEFLDKHTDLDAHAPPPAQKAPTRIPNPEGKVLELNEQTFSGEVKNGGVFVKFFAPWCGHCKKLAPVWTQLAEQMKNQLTIAEVNCDEHNGLCRAEDVQGYPMLFYYDDDGVKTEYTGGRKLEQLQEFVEKVLKPYATSFRPLFRFGDDTAVDQYRKSDPGNSTHNLRPMKSCICSCTRRRTATRQ